MPVHFDEYEEHADDIDISISGGSNAGTIVAFLLDHPDTGFTPTEIAEATDIPEGSVGPTLQRLRRHDLVRHKEPYWAIADDDRLAAYEAMLHSMAAESDTGSEWADIDSEDYVADQDELAAWRDRQRNTDE